MLIAIIAIYLIVFTLGLGLVALAARFRMMEPIIAYMALERYGEMLGEAQERARAEAARRMIDGERWG
jgi:hypothetical protein